MVKEYLKNRENFGFVLGRVLGFPRTKFEINFLTLGKLTGGYFKTEIYQDLELYHGF